jgi:small subunit ribosomal protein S16
MLKVRLQRTGRKHEPTFRVVVTESQNSTKSGKFLEIVGAYDARTDKNTVLDGERIKYWMSKGALLTGTVNNLLISKDIIKGKKINVLPKKTVAKKEEEAIPAAPAPEAEAVSAPVEEAPAA